MQPKKRILIIDESETRLSVLSFALGINGYKILPAGNKHEALIAAGEGTPPDLAILCWPVREADRLLRRLRGSAPYCNTLLLAESSDKVPEFLDVNMVIARGISQAGILDAVKMLSRRRRGPQRIPPVPAGAIELRELKRFA